MAVLLLALVLCALPDAAYAAPLESGFIHAPSPTASPADKAAAYRESRLRVINAAEKYLNTPYQYGGLDRRGLDCSGLVYLSFQDALGVTIPRNTWSMYSWVEKIQLSEARPGDLVFFATTGQGTASHVGIFTGNDRFIHSASEGPSTGVIYSTLDERYWSRTYLGAGRVLPSVDINNNDTGTANSSTQAAKNTVNAPGNENKQSRDIPILLGFAAAPTWRIIKVDSPVVRGIAGQLRFGVEVKLLGRPMILGAELRPEWDRALSIFRVPLTLSWGLTDTFRIFAGPAISFGDAVLSVDGNIRQYTGGTTWFGAAGITVAPFAIPIGNGSLDPYGELAWQSYVRNNADRDVRADLAAGFRVSTGLRYTWKK